MEIREAEPGDAAALIHAYDWLFAPPGGPPPRWVPDEAVAALADVAAGERSAVFAAYDGDGDELAGLCTVALDLRSVRYGQRAWVEDLVVAPGHRSQGVGKALLDTAKAWARERGASHLELDSGDARPDAHRFYEREHPSWTSRCFGWQL